MELQVLFKVTMEMILCSALLPQLVVVVVETTGVREKLVVLVEAVAHLVPEAQAMRVHFLQ